MKCYLSFLRHKRLKNSSGFTLIELLVVISIIGFIATASVVALKASRDKAKNEMCLAGLNQILKAIEVKRDEKDLVLKDITGSGWSAGLCGSPTYNDEDLTSSACINRLTTAYRNLGFTGIQYDPWGKPYLFDENEYEIEINPCRRDYLFSLSCGNAWVPFYRCK